MYPSLLGVASALNIKDSEGHVRSNMYVANLAPVGSAKSVVVEAAEKSISLPPETVQYSTPSSDRGLAKMIGEDGNTILLCNDEFRAVLGKCQIPNSTLPQMFCTLWSKDHAGVADKKGFDKCIGKLSVLGNIACDDPTEFAKVFGNSTVTGMYDRFLFGYDTEKVKYRPLKITPGVFNKEMLVRIPKWVWDAKDRWGGDDIGRRRLTEHALRVAMVTAAINGDTEITAPCFAAALRFVEWQERIRNKFRPGLAETKEAECLEAVYSALLDQKNYQMRTKTFPKHANVIGHGKDYLSDMLNFTDVIKEKRLYRKYSSLVTRVKHTMIDDGIIERIHEVEFDEKTGNEKEGDPTPFYVLCKSL
jgi:hypothetical protein